MRKFPKVLVIWSTGMLGSDFMTTQKWLWDIVGLDSCDIDIRNSDEVQKVVRTINPDFVLNCSAYTRVDDAEDIGCKENFDVNALGVWHLARACKVMGCGFVTISTDYVFEGTKEEGYSSEDVPNPINSYGMAKYVGERLAMKEFPQSVVIRTSWLYGWGTEVKNFVNTMLRLGRERLEIRVISDQIGAPTHTVDLCEYISYVMRAYSGHGGAILHYSNVTENINGVSWYDFACEIYRFSNLKVKIIPIASSEYPQKAKRPFFSKMIVDAPLGLQRDWKTSLEAYLANKSCEPG